MGKLDTNKKVKEDSLLNTAFSLFTTKGVSKTSISDIVNNAGVAKGTFYLYFKDKYEGPMTVSQIQPGDIVDVNFLKGKRQIASVQISPQAWCYENIDNYDLGGINHTASIGSSVFSLPDEAAILSGGNRIENMEVVKQDVVTIR